MCIRDRYKTGSKFLVPLYGFRGWPIKKWHSNLPRTLPGCHGNEIWDNMGHNSASAGDICEIFASIGGFSGLGHQILPTKFYPNRFLLPWQRNLKQKGYNSDFVRDISKIFASSGRFWGTGYWMRPILFHHNRPLLPFECHMTANELMFCTFIVFDIIFVFCSWVSNGSFVQSVLWQASLWTLNQRHGEKRDACGSWLCSTSSSVLYFSVQFMDQIF